jgi:hypothetical protein
MTGTRSFPLGAGSAASTFPVEKPADSVVLVLLLDTGIQDHLRVPSIQYYYLWKIKVKTLTSTSPGSSLWPERGKTDTLGWEQPFCGMCLLRMALAPEFYSWSFAVQQSSNLSQLRCL